MKRIRIQYYAMLREQRGCPGESVETAAVTAEELYRELSSRHGLRLRCDHLRVAVNDEVMPWSARLNAGDRVAFLPPVSGG
jgi:molybdopterin converting factor subunit 1